MSVRAFERGAYGENGFSCVSWLNSPIWKGPQGCGLVERNGASRLAVARGRESASDTPCGRWWEHHRGTTPAAMLDKLHPRCVRLASNVRCVFRFRRGPGLGLAVKVGIPPNNKHECGPRGGTVLLHGCPSYFG